MNIDNPDLIAEKPVENFKSKKTTKNSALLKIFLIILVSFIIIIIYQNFQIKNSSSVKNFLPIATNTHTISDDNLLDVSEEYKNNNEATLHDLNLSEIKEKGAEFVYQLLIKNQVQIEELNNQVRLLKIDLDRVKNQEKFNKLILSYIDLREKIFSNTDCKKEIENFDLLIAKDEFLIKKFSVIKENFSEMIPHETLIKNFNQITKDLIINENYNHETADLLSKIQHNFKKLVIIRKITNTGQNSLEQRIVNIENLLKQKNYNSVLTELLALDKLYFPIIEKFLEDIGLIIEINNADQDIIRYLKSLN
jgi:hypothetical protein